VDLEEKLLSFVRWHDEIPPDARRITAEEAATHGVRRNVGVSSASDYVIGFEAGDTWWTLFFEPVREVSTVVEVWKVDCYNSAGRSWQRRFWYWPNGRWQQVSPRDAAQLKDASPAADR
jgi:hypothetical protein